jgi:hypothetical protein
MMEKITATPTRSVHERLEQLETTVYDMQAHPTPGDPGLAGLVPEAEPAPDAAGAAAPTPFDLAQPVVCPHCGWHNRIAHAACTMCGQPLHDPRATPGSCLPEAPPRAPDTRSVPPLRAENGIP